MLHKKRTYGLLYGKIIDKSEKDKLNDTRIYPNENTDKTTILNYNYHTLKLNFSYENTSNCEDGCYLLVTFEQKGKLGETSLIGYEFSILTRFWNYTDYISNIVDIAFNEYIIGCFEIGSITHHYYSLYIPKDARKIIIQIEGNYLDGYIGEGRIKINTVKKIGNTEKLKIYSEKNVLNIDIKEKGFAGKIISFAFRSKDSYDDIFSYYYFRVLYAKENEIIYYPLDSNLGNLCIPEGNDDSNYSYCYFVFSNKYNELSRKFIISSTILNELYYINITKVFGNRTIEERKKFIYVDLEINKDIKYYLFKFQFPNRELKNIITSVLDNATDIYPQIYSYQMFFTESYKLHHFKMISNYTFYHQYVYGYQGSVSISFLTYQNYSCSRNFRGKPLSITINSETDTINCSVIKFNFSYFIKLQYNRKNKAVEEIKSGEIFSQFIIGRNFPLYFYLKVKNKKYINMDITIRVNSYIDEILKNNFEIKGYVLDEKTIQRKINGEYIRLNNPKPGDYLESFKIGSLKINQEIVNEENYILIEIRSGEKNQVDSYLLVELIAKEYNNDTYFLPINLYQIETFDGEGNQTFTENKYYLTNEEKRGDEVLIDLSCAYDDVKIEFDNSIEEKEKRVGYLTGFKKFRVNNTIDNNVYFKVVNPSRRPKANYMIRYYYTGLTAEYNYSLNDSDRVIDKKYLNNQNATICITYNSIKIFTGLKENPIIVPRKDVYFNIYAFLFKKDSKAEEHLNTTCKLNERKYLYKTISKHHYNYTNLEKWNITFENISRAHNYVYELQIKANSFFPNKTFDEEFLVFTSEIDLTDILYKEDKKGLIVGVSLGAVGGVIVIVLVVFFIVKYKRLQKSNINLKEDLKSLAYSNDVQKEVLVKENKGAKKDNDYESTFI